MKINLLGSFRADKSSNFGILISIFSDFLSEIVKLRVKDVDPEAGTVFIRAMPRSMARTLKLKTNQVMLFYNYIHEVRPKLLRTDTDRLVLTLRGSAENGEGINYLIETLKQCSRRGT